MAASAFLKNNVSIEEWMATTTFCEIRTMFSEENCSLPLNTRTCEKKWFFLGTTSLDHSLLVHRFLYICQ